MGCRNNGLSEYWDVTLLDNTGGVEWNKLPLGAHTTVEVSFITKSLILSAEYVTKSPV